MFESKADIGKKKNVFTFQYLFNDMLCSVPDYLHVMVVVLSLPAHLRQIQWHREREREREARYPPAVIEVSYRGERGDGRPLLYCRP